jgi:hypothetical protein
MVDGSKAHSRHGGNPELVPEGAREVGTKA